MSEETLKRVQCVTANVHTGLVKPKKLLADQKADLPKDIADALIEAKACKGVSGKPGSTIGLVADA